MSPKVLWLVTGILGAFALLPGLPFLPFIALAGATGGLAASGRAGGEAPATTSPELPAGRPKEDRPEALLSLDLMELEVGFELVPLVEGEGADLVDRIRTLRRQLALEMGFIVPPIHIRDNLQIKPNEYVILVKGIEVGRGDIRSGHQLAINPGTAETTVPGIPTHEPAFGLPALWIAKQERERSSSPADWSTPPH
jgi:flagellar biosynthesis protein FlhA